MIFEVTLNKRLPRFALSSSSPCSASYGCNIQLSKPGRTIGPSYNKNVCIQWHSKKLPLTVTLFSRPNTVTVSGEACNNNLSIAQAHFTRRNWAKNIQNWFLLSIPDILVLRPRHCSMSSEFYCPSFGILHMFVLQVATLVVIKDMHAFLIRFRCSFSEVPMLYD